MPENQSSPKDALQPDQMSNQTSSLVKVMGCAIWVVLLIVGGLLLSAFFGNPAEAPRNVIESRIQNAIPGDPIVFFQVQARPGDEESSFGLVKRHEGIVVRDPGSPVPSSAINSAIKLAAGSHPIVLTYGPDDQLDRLGILAFPIVDGQVRDEQINAVVAIADSVTPDEDAAEIRAWIERTLVEFNSRPASVDKAMVVRRSLGPFRANITLSRKDAFVGTVRPGVEMIVGLVP